MLAVYSQKSQDMHVRLQTRLVSPHVLPAYDNNDLMSIG